MPGFVGPILYLMFLEGNSVQSTAFCYTAHSQPLKEQQCSYRLAKCLGLTRVLQVSWCLSLLPLNASWARRNLEHRSSCESLVLWPSPQAWMLYRALPGCGGQGTGGAAALAASPLGLGSRPLLGWEPWGSITGACSAVHELLSLRYAGGSENALRTVRCRFGELLLQHLGKQRNPFLMSFLAWNALKALLFENMSSVGDAHGSLHSPKLILLLGDFTHQVADSLQ